MTRGYPVGFIASVPSKKTPQHFLFNHVRIIVKYSEIPEEFDGQRIVGFEVVPFSIKVKKKKKILNNISNSIFSIKA